MKHKYQYNKKTKINRTAAHLEQGGIRAVNINMGDPSSIIPMNEQGPQEWHIVDTNDYTRQV